MCTICSHVSLHHREGAGKSELDWEEAEALKRWNSLSTKEKVTDWALQNRWRIFVAGWATSMGVSWVLLQRNKTQSFSQKLVQARVYVSFIRPELLSELTSPCPFFPPSRRKRSHWLVFSVPLVCRRCSQKKRKSRNLQTTRGHVWYVGF